MAFVDNSVNMFAEIEPVWLLVLLLVGSALAVLLPAVHTWLVRNKHWQRATVAAQTALQQGRHNEAEKMFLALLKKTEEEFGPQDPKVAGAMRHLAMLYQVQGRRTDAEQLLHRSLAIMEKADPGNIETSSILEHLAGLCEAQGRYAATELILQRSLSIRERALGPDHPYVANVLNQMVILYYKMGKKDEAKRLEERRSAMSNGPSSSAMTSRRENGITMSILRL